MQNKRWKKQKYLSWESAKTILKLRGATCGLNRYSYVTTKYKSKVDQKCPNCNHPTEDIDHFLWDCTFYKDEREKWFLELCHIDEFRAIFYQKDSLKLLSRLNLFYFFKPSLFYILNALTLRVNRK
ncbi:hypothetical protein M0813_05864 [Anaeramoeba flamelloides]|uniref:Reverse transcriptase zinc-binding domain-containing protein n=1 Tax=Anaeramoeba flamelloides TaxID=1746091 RepID=A0ABQ8XIB7_9EUKA|nr:hypothetical protein M0813_05864 [Anaeramoeba flamelloides]